MSFFESSPLRGSQGFVCLAAKLTDTQSLASREGGEKLARWIKELNVGVEKSL